MPVFFKNKKQTTGYGVNTNPCHVIHGSGHDQSIYTAKTGNVIVSQKNFIVGSTLTSIRHCSRFFVLGKVFKTASPHVSIWHWPLIQAQLCFPCIILFSMSDWYRDVLSKNSHKIPIILFSRNVCSFALKSSMMVFFALT